MEDIEFCLYFYALGVVIAELIVLYDLRKLAKDGYILHADYFLDITLISLLSWYLVFYRFTVLLIDFVIYWYVWIVFKYKMWKIKNSNNTNTK